MLAKDQNDQYFTSRFATFDIESKLTATSVKDIRDRRLNCVQETYGDDETINDYVIAEGMEQDAIDIHINNQLVYDDDGQQITGEEFRQKYDGEEYVLGNIPLSYVIAYNFGTDNDDSGEQEQQYEYVQPLEYSDKCTIEGDQVSITRSTRNPKELISSFYQDIKDICKKYRKHNLIYYEDLLECLKEWLMNED